MLRIWPALLVLWSTTALAQQTWRSALRLDTPFEVQTRSTKSDSAELFSPRLTATWYVTPLRDDPDVPLPLLVFFQRPGSLALGFSDELDV